MRDKEIEREWDRGREMNQSLILRHVVEGGEHIKEESRDKEKYLSNSPPHNQKKHERK